MGSTCVPRASSAERPARAPAGGHAAPRPFAGGHKGRSHGFDLHAGRPIGAKRNDRREQLCRYLLRPALSADRLHLTPDGQVLLAIKTPGRDGTTHLELSPTDLIARLAALVCRPRANQILHLGVLSRAAERGRDESREHHAEPPFVPVVQHTLQKVDIGLPRRSY